MMKQFYLKTLVLLLLAMVGQVASAYNCEVDGIYYNLDEGNKTAEVTKSSYKYQGVVVIPSTVTYNGTTYSVNSIDDRAFDGCTGLTSITIPNSVTIL